MGSKTKRLKAQRKIQRHQKDDRKSFRVNEEFRCGFTIERGVVDDNGAINLSFSSESAVRDWYGPPVILLHEKRAVNFSRLTSALFNHDPDRIVGRVDRPHIDMEDRKTRATVVIDDDEPSQEILSKIKSGSLRGVSVSYVASKSQRVGEGEEWASPEGRKFKGPAIIATRWQPIELSFTPIPADSAVGVGRTDETIQEGSTMINAKVRAALIEHGMPQDATDGDAIVYLNEHPEVISKRTGKLELKKLVISQKKPDEPETKNQPADGSERAIRAERQRTADLHEIGRKAGMSADRVAEWVADGTPVDVARAEAFDFYAQKNKPIGQSRIVEQGDNDLTKWNRYVRANWISRAGMEAEKDAPTDGPRHIRMIDALRRFCAIRSGQDTQFLEFDQLAGTRDFHHSVSDFANLLENVANKKIRAGYEEAPTTYQWWTVPGTLPDFKPARRVNLSEIKDFQENPELSPIDEQTLVDAKESIQLITYGNRFSCSRETIYNDDLGGITKKMGRFGQAGNRTINKLVYDHLTGTPTMTEDSLALFSASHTSGSNYTSSGTAISVTSIGAGKALMRKQKGLNAAATLNLTPAIIIVNAAKETLCEQTLNGMYVPTAASSAVVPSMRSLKQVTESYLDGKSATAWYLVADTRIIDTIEVARLAGQSAPVLTRVVGTDILGIAWIAYLDVGIRVLDHRGLYMNAGA